MMMKKVCEEPCEVEPTKSISVSAIWRAPQSRLGTLPTVSGHCMQGHVCVLSTVLCILLVWECVLAKPLSQCIDVLRLEENGVVALPIFKCLRLLPRSMQVWSAASRVVVWVRCVPVIYLNRPPTVVPPPLVASASHAFPPASSPPQRPSAPPPPRSPVCPSVQDTVASAAYHRHSLSLRFRSGYRPTYYLTSSRTGMCRQGPAPTTMVNSH